MTGNPLEAARVKQHQSNAVEMVDRYWRQMAAGGQVPSRMKINPGDIQDALEFAFVAEHISGGIVRMRIAGGSIKAVMGMEVAGMPAATLIAPKERKAFNETALHVLNTPSTAKLTLTAAAKYGQPGMEAEMRLYPLRGVTGGITQMLGTFVTTGSVGQTPRRFDVTSTEFEAVDASLPAKTRPILSRGHLSLVVSR